ncbi:MAG: hypothetical protein MK364_18115, partial [Pirellulales bacterium]|nr:hypothetical protein [Pirellulales bacterium]
MPCNVARQSTRDTLILPYDQPDFFRESFFLLTPVAPLRWLTVFRVPGDCVVDALVVDALVVDALVVDALVVDALVETRL